ncbi:MAG: hypothetical protein KC484_02385 [Colwelliaceae bacterium]|nr:hypothetical protein [Colwelliaceae bacterium]
MSHFLRIIVLLSALALTSCASMNFEDFFEGYAQQMEKVIYAQKQGDFDKALSLISKKNTSHNAYNLSLLEKGRLEFLSKNWEQSQFFFNDAYRTIKQESAKANIQISKGLQNVGAVISNDSAIKYQVPAYEQSMMHSYQALNYLYQGSIESALVEVRKANLVQELALDEHADDIFSAQQETIEEGVTHDTLNSVYPSMNEMIGDVKNGFQNAFTFYLSALLYESVGELNDAYIDYKKSLEIFPDNHYLKSDVLRLGKELNMIDDLAEFSDEDLLGSTLLLKDKYKGESGQLVILYEQGLVNKKQEKKLNLPLYTRHDDMRFFSFSLPVYQSINQVNQPLYLHYNQQTFQSDEIVILQSLATKQLVEQLPELITRQSLRIVAKEKMRRQMKQEGGDVGNIIASLYSIASEKADTRSWLSLPNRVHLLKVELPVGEHALSLEHINGHSVIDVNINAERISLINLTTVGTYTGYKSTNL